MIEIQFNRKGTAYLSVDQQIYTKGRPSRNKPETIARELYEIFVFGEHPEEFGIEEVRIKDDGEIYLQQRGEWSSHGRRLDEKDASALEEELEIYVTGLAENYDALPSEQKTVDIETLRKERKFGRI